MNIVKVKNDREHAKRAKAIMLEAGNHIGVVHFRTKKENKKRRISYRLHVSHPTYAPVPKGTGHKKQQEINRKHDLITVFDTNMVRYNKSGSKMTGRGGFKSIPLTNITRIAVGGEIYKFVN